MKNRFYILFLLCFLVLIIIFPKLAFEGSVNGLLLWFHTVLPTLLPFIILTGILLKSNIISILTKYMHPLFKNLFHLSPNGCYCLVCGLLCGYPMGAKTVSQLILSKKISNEEGQYLLGIANNVSPAFFLNFVLTQTMHFNKEIFIYFFILYAEIFIFAFITRPNKRPASYSKNKKETYKITFQMLDESIMDGFETITRLGGYIILFAIIAKMATALIPAITILKPLIIGIIELTNGIMQMQSITLPIYQALPLAYFLCIFGGICGIAQTQSMIQQTKLSIKKYIYTKIILGIFCMLPIYIYCMINLLYVNQ